MQIFWSQGWELHTRNGKFRVIPPDGPQGDFPVLVRLDLDLGTFEVRTHTGWFIKIDTNSEHQLSEFALKERCNHGH